VDGSYYIDDSGSVNSTRVERTKDGERKFLEVKPGSPVRLEHGDILHFGLAQVRFMIVEHIDPALLAEIGSEQERISVRRQGEKMQKATMRLPANRPE
jgi:hypothetical protein